MAETSRSVERAPRVWVWRLPILAVLLVGLVGTATALLSAWGLRRVVWADQYENLEARIDLQRRRLESAFSEIEHDVDFLATLAANPRPVEELEPAMVALAQAKPHYLQIRILEANESGVERVRIDRPSPDVDAPADAPPNPPSVVAREALQSKGDRDYFRATLAEPHDRVFFSEIDLNRERGAISAPHQATLRALRVVSGADGSPRWVVAINLDFERFIDELFEPQAQSELWLANASGDYLYHPDPALPFAWELGPPHRVARDYPSVAEWFEADTPGVRLERLERSVLGMATAAPFRDARRIIVGIEASTDSMLAASGRVLFESILLSMAFMAVAGLLVRALAVRFVAPLGDMADAAKAIKAGDWEAPLPTEREDELGTLARALRKMVDGFLARTAELDERSETLAEANRELELFVHVASHDLREPIRRISLAAELLEADEAERLQPESRETLAILSESARRSLAQLTSLRELTRTMTGKRALEPTDVLASLRGLLARHEASFAAADLQVVTEMPATGPTLALVPGQVELALDNLLRNAERHAPRGSELRVHAELAAGEVLLTFCNPLPEGAAAPTDELLMPFHRDEASTGTGLGLAIVDRVARRHHGEVHIDADEGLFRVRLILREQP